MYFEADRVILDGYGAHGFTSEDLVWSTRNLTCLALVCENGNGQLESRTVSYNAILEEMLIRRARSRGDVRIFVGNAHQIRLQLYSALELRATMLLIRWQVRVIHIGAEPALVLGEWCCESSLLLGYDGGKCTVSINPSDTARGTSGAKGKSFVWSRTLDSPARLVQFLGRVFNTQKRKRDDCPEQP